MTNSLFNETPYFDTYYVTEELYSQAYLFCEWYELMLHSGQAHRITRNDIKLYKLGKEVISLWQKQQ